MIYMIGCPAYTQALHIDEICTAKRRGYEVIWYDVSTFGA
jgi:hypothetical protein